MIQTPGREFLLRVSYLEIYNEVMIILVDQYIDINLVIEVFVFDQQQTSSNHYVGFLLFMSVDVFSSVIISLFWFDISVGVFCSQIELS